VREYLFVLVVAAAVTFLLVPGARVLALRVGGMSEVRDRDVHTVPTPRMGGLAMLGGLLVATGFASRLPFLSAITVESSHAEAVCVAGAFIVLLGALDDVYSLDALTKLLGQVVAGGILVLNGVQLLRVPNVFGEGSINFGPYDGMLVTILVVVVTINAVNFVDGLDGLAAGVVAIGALAMLAFSYQAAVLQNLDRAAPPMLIAAVAAGVCLGFLPHNVHPATVFMGDTGSMLLGLLLASSTISYTGQAYDPNVAGNAVPAFIPLLLPLVMLAVPMVDLVLAVFRRSLAGVSPFAPDKMHLHHRLLELGHSQRRAVLLMWAWSALVAFGAVALAYRPGTATVVALSIGAALLVVISVLTPFRRRGQAESVAAGPSDTV
jgi:UDP-GlcNAc:undecaprenyl-phosphate GlcNAc-1-phosphate transferase